MKNVEVWKCVMDFEDAYCVNKIGDIKSLSKKYFNKANNSYSTKNEYIAKFYINKRGYKSITLRKNINNIIKSKGFPIHRLVATAFIPNPENKPQVNHINGIKTDNRVENLEWCTSQENIKHALDTGLKIPLKGDKHVQSKLTNIQVLEIRKSILTQKELTNIYGVSKATISSIISRRNWKHI